MSTNLQTSVSLSPSMRIILCDLLQILGIVALVLIICTAWLSSRLCRAAFWFLFIISSILCSVASILLLGQQTGPEPSKITCLIQVSMLYSAAIFNAFAALSGLLQIYLSIRMINITSALHSRLNIIALKKAQMNVIPVVISMGVLASWIWYGLQVLPAVKRDPSGLRCQMPILPSLYKIILVAIASIILVFEILVIKRMRQIGEEYDGLPIRGKIPRAGIKRVLALISMTFVLVLLAVLGYASDVDKGEAGEDVYDIILSIMPVLTAVIFGSQEDIWNVWMSALRVKKSQTRV